MIATQATPSSAPPKAGKIHYPVVDKNAPWFQTNQIPKGPPPPSDIFVASYNGEEARVKELVEGDSALANAADGHGNTPLHYACLYGRTPVVQFLLGKGARVAVATKNGVRFCPLRTELGPPRRSSSLTRSGARDYRGCTEEVGDAL